MKENLRQAALALQARFNEFDTSAAGVDCSVLQQSLPPIFIVGAPRTGSTLLYQLLVQQLQVTYISNLMAAFPKYMVRLLRAWPGLMTGPPSKLHPGYYGFVPGLRAPSEAGKVLDRWFASGDRPQHTQAIRDTIAALSLACDAPFLIKSLTNSTRLGQLAEVFPAARFVLIRRHPLYVAQSILLAREKLGVPQQGWWSVEVPGFEAVLGRSPAYQAVWQVQSIERLLAEDFRRLGIEPVVVEYEALCQSPRTVLERLQDALAIDWRDDRPPLPEDLQRADRVRVDADVWRQLESAYADLGGDGAGCREA